MPCLRARRGSCMRSVVRSIGPNTQAASAAAWFKPLNAFEPLAARAVSPCRGTGAEVETVCEIGINKLTATTVTICNDQYGAMNINKLHDSQLHSSWHSRARCRKKSPS